MEHRILGKTGLEVSRLGLGAAQHGDLDRRNEDVERSLHHALVPPVELLDDALLRARSLFDEQFGGSPTN